MMKDASMSPQSFALHPAGQRFGVALDVPNPKPSLMPFLLQASGRVQRKLAHRLIMPTYDGEPDEATAGPASSDPTSAAAAAAARASCKKGHRLPATAVVLSGDESFAVTVSKDGSIIKWDLATLQRTRLFRPGERASGKPLPPGHGEDAATSSGPEWVKRNPRQASKRPRRRHRLELITYACSVHPARMGVAGNDVVSEEQRRHVKLLTQDCRR